MHFCKIQFSGGHGCAGHSGTLTSGQGVVVGHGVVVVVVVVRVVVDGGVDGVGTGVVVVGTSRHVVVGGGVVTGGGRLTSRTPG